MMTHSFHGKFRLSRRGQRAGVTVFLGLVVLFIGAKELAAQPNSLPPDGISPPVQATAKDTPGDAGGSITVRWELSPDDRPDNSAFEGYVIYRSETSENQFKQIAVVSKAAKEFRDANVKDNLSYIYRITARTAGGESAPAQTDAAHSGVQWFNVKKINLLVIALIISATVIFYIEYLKAGKKTFIRKIAGLEAIDEAIGRATEMGKPVLYVPGIADMNDIQTVASLTILSHVSRQLAQYDTPLEMPTSKALVMTTARETVKEAYLAAGRPDAYSEDAIYYLTDEQFGYVAGVNGIMMRKKPAACFYLGAFYAESLVLAETGNDIGAIQIAGTAMPAQLPFFVAACDYTLLGEELFAASAYLSGEPRQLGSLKGQDMGKLVAMVCIVLGAALATAANLTGSAQMAKMVELFKGFFTGAA